jgi:predicted DNA-binding antitoxin AbrB/MazE fold protein
MAQIVRAVYEHEQLRPLDPLALSDGLEIRVTVLAEQVRSALADLLASVHAEPADEMDEAALVTTIDAALWSTPPPSRRSNPSGHRDNEEKRRRQPWRMASRSTWRNSSGALLIRCPLIKKADWSPGPI